MRPFSAHGEYSNVLESVHDLAGQDAGERLLAQAPFMTLHIATLIPNRYSPYETKPDNQ
jgi:hypothetical protein